MHYEYEYGTPSTICTTSDGGGREEEQDDEDDEEEEEDDSEEYGDYTRGEYGEEETSLAEDKYSKEVNYSSVSNDKFIKDEDDTKTFAQVSETVPSSFRSGTSLPESEAVDERRTRKELSICGTHIDSFYGASGIDTHSVCVQTEASDLEDSMTTPAGAVEQPLEKVFKDFGTMTSGQKQTERREEGHGTRSEADKCVSENSLPTNISGESPLLLPGSEIGLWTEADGEEEEYENIVGTRRDVFSTDQASEVKEVKAHAEKEEAKSRRQHCALIADKQTPPSSLHDDGALPKVHNRDVVVQPTDTHVTATTTGSRTATSVNTGPSLTWCEAEVEEAAAAPPPVALNVWAQRQEEGGVVKEGVHGNRNIKYCQGKERATGQQQLKRMTREGKHHESDDIDKNNDNSTGGSSSSRTEGEQYRNCNTCSCRSCQFCRSPASPRTMMTRTEMTGAEGQRQGREEKTMSRKSGPGLGAKERKQSDNCTASSCPSSFCLRAASSTTSICCCCCSAPSSPCPSGCFCCSTSTASPICGRSTAAATATASSGQKSEDSKSPSENSATTTINCPTRRRRVAELTSHCRHPRLTTTKSVVGYNNHLDEKSSRECCERPRRELIKSVRTVPEVEEYEEEEETVVLNEKKVATDTLTTNTERHSWEIGRPRDAKVDANNGRLESIKGQEMLELDFKNAANKGLSRTRAIAQSASTMDLDSNLPDALTDEVGNVTEEEEEEYVRRYDKGKAERSNKGTVKDKITKEMEERKLDQDDEGEADDILDKSTPETVINNDNSNNNREKAKSCSNDDELATRSTGYSDGEEEDEEEANEYGDSARGRGRGVLEWARRKKRKVQSQLNEERQRHINVNRLNAMKKKHINRASATEDRTRMRGSDVTNNSSNTNGSWSVTVAGCYNPNMAPPDLQMRLSFPGTRSAVQHAASSSSASMDMMNCWNETTTTTSMSVPKLPRPSLPAPKTVYEEEVVPELDLKQATNVSDDDDDELQDEDQKDMRGQVLPVIDLVSKQKSLMRAPLEDCKFISRKEMVWNS